jgi:hypothetical protein
VCFVSNNIHARVVHRDETVAQQTALLHRQPLIFQGVPGDLPEFRNRLLFPVLMATVTSLSGVNSRQAFLFVRWVTAFACFVLFWAFTVRLVGGGTREALMGQAMLTMILVLSFNHPWEHPTDFPDVAVMIAAVWAAMRRNLALAALIAILGAANRESAAFTGVIWIAVAWSEDAARLRALFEGAVLSASALGMTTLLRYLFRVPGGRLVNSVGENPLWPSIREALAHPFMSWPMLLAAMLIPPLLLAFTNWQGSRAGRHVVMAGVLLAAVSLVIGDPGELRVSLSPATIVLCGGLLLLTSNPACRVKPEAAFF